MKKTNHRIDYKQYAAYAVGFILITAFVVFSYRHQTKKKRLEAEKRARWIAEREHVSTENESLSATVNTNGIQYLDGKIGKNGIIVIPAYEVVDAGEDFRLFRRLTDDTVQVKWENGGYTKIVTINMAAQVVTTTEGEGSNWGKLKNEQTHIYSLTNRLETDEEKFARLTSEINTLKAQVNPPPWGNCPDKIIGCLVYHIDTDTNTVGNLITGSTTTNAVLTPTR